MKKVLKVSLSCILLAVLVSCGGGKAVKDSKTSDPNRGRETGYATIFDNDTALARDRATDDAKSKLVRKILGESIKGQSIMENYELVSNIVEAKSFGLVKRVEVIKQGKSGETEYFVTIEGTVEPAVVEDAIDDALERYGRPKFMVLVNESIEGRKNAPGMTVTELTIMNIMGNSGFDFVDAAMTQELMKKERSKMQKAVSGKVSDDVQDLLLDDAGAEVIIFGSVVVTDQSSAMKQYSNNMKSKQANINLKAVDVYTGSIIATAVGNAASVHIDGNTAAKDAIQKCLGQSKLLGKNDDNDKFQAGAFMKTIIKKFVKAANSREIKIVIAGLSAAELKDFRDQVSNRIRGVQKVIERGRDGRAAKLEVRFAGKTNDFEEELSAKASAMGYEINITSSRPNKLIMTAKKIN